MTPATSGPSPLEILARSFRPIALPTRVPKNCVRCGTMKCGVYLLVAGGEIVYVGSSTDIELQLYAHANERERERYRGLPFHKEFDGALWQALPEVVMPHYEGAFIRALRPRYNGSAPRGGEHDAEILEGFDLGHLVAELRPFRKPPRPPLEDLDDFEDLEDAS